MPKGRTSRCRTPLVLAFTLLLALAAAACGDGGGPAATPSGPGAPERVTYQAEDGLRIVADFYPPLEGESAPAVLLLHQFNGSRVQWATLIPDLRQWGYAVLAPDLRSFGESTVILRDGAQEQYELTDLDDMLLDVAAAIEYLKTRGEVDAEAIGVVGASVGGNLAYVASGAFPQLNTAVSMSPNASPSGDALLGRDVPGFSPRSVLFMSDEAEASDAQALAVNVAQPVDVRIYERTTAHGVELLGDPEVKPDIRDWLTANLPLASGE